MEVRYEYRAFGEQLKRLNSTGDTVDDLGKYSYSGKELDGDTNLYYFNARYYDAVIGRFINVDPIQDGLNWYLFCNNNPLCFVDPTGLTQQTMEAARAASEKQMADRPPSSSTDRIQSSDPVMSNNAPTAEDEVIQAEMQRIDTLQSDQVAPARIGQPTLLDVGPANNQVMHTGDPSLAIGEPGAIQKKGYTDINLSISSMYLGVTGGAIIDLNDGEVSKYAGVSFNPVPSSVLSVSGTVTNSNQSVSKGLLFTVEGNAFNVAGQFGYSVRDKSFFGESGFTTSKMPSFSVSAMYVWE